MPPYEALQIPIIIKANKSDQPIEVKAVDVETQSKLLLNKSSAPVYLISSDVPETVTNIIISAKGKILLQGNGN